MKLICELQESVEYELIEEGAKPKQYFIEGIFMQSEKKNKNGRLDILNKLDETINNPNDSVKAHAPKMVNLEISKDFIGLVIGPGGKNIQELQKDTETTIVINVIMWL